MAFSGNLPLGLYIHLPWCERKCPYCDFNSHEADSVPENDYVAALLHDIEQDLPLIWGRSIDSVFIGGGTPSLFSGDAIDRLFSGIRALLKVNPGIEISIESNPGSADSEHFRAYRECGINRLSIGVQSFDDDKLSALGRIHSSEQAIDAVQIARRAGFDNINIDLMYGLPAQTTAQALDDVQRAIRLGVEHISHYQLTIEANTLFHHKPPEALPDDELSWQQQAKSQKLLSDAGYQQYEISAHSQRGRQCRHNLNYWHFGDYLGIGAGAHGKITLAGESRIIRRVRQRQPGAYLQTHGRDTIISERTLDESDLIFEFMLNSLRLKDGFESRLLTENTGLSLNTVLPILEVAKGKGLIEYDAMIIQPTKLGFRFLNDLQTLFLDYKPTKNQPFYSSEY